MQCVYCHCWWLLRLNVSIRQTMYFSVRAWTQSNQSTGRHDHTIPFFVLFFCCCYFLKHQTCICVNSCNVYWLTTIFGHSMCINRRLVHNIFFTFFFSQAHYLSQSHTNSDPKNVRFFLDRFIDWMHELLCDDGKGVYWIR